LAFTFVQETRNPTADNERTGIAVLAVGRDLRS
jgi:hypothetical protein